MRGLALAAQKPAANIQVGKVRLQLKPLRSAMHVGDAQPLTMLLQLQHAVARGQPFAENRHLLYSQHPLYAVLLLRCTQSCLL